MTYVNTTPQIHGQNEEWSETDEGHRTIYTMDPALIPASVAQRVIYELRLDAERLNAEAMEYFDRLKRWEP